MRHDSVEKLLHSVVNEGVGQAERQQQNLPSAERTIPDLVIFLNNQPFLCDVTIVDTLADTNLAVASKKSGGAAEAAAAKKVVKYQLVAQAMGAKHLPFAVETTGGMSELAKRLIREIHFAAHQHCTWRDVEAVGSHLVDAIAIAVQRCSGMALRASLERERRIAMGTSAA